MAPVGQAAAWVCFHCNHAGWCPCGLFCSESQRQWALGKVWVSSHQVSGRQAAGHMVILGLRFSQPLSLLQTGRPSNQPPPQAPPTLLSLCSVPATCLRNVHPRSRKWVPGASPGPRGPRGCTLPTFLKPCSLPPPLPLGFQCRCFLPEHVLESSTPWLFTLSPEVQPQEGRNSRLAHHQSPRTWHGAWWVAGLNKRGLKFSVEERKPTEPQEGRLCRGKLGC